MPRGYSSHLCRKEGSVRQATIRHGQIKPSSNRVARTAQAVSGADPGSGPPFLETRYSDDFLVRVKPQKFQFHEPLSLFKKMIGDARPETECLANSLPSRDRPSFRFTFQYSPDCRLASSNRRFPGSRVVTRYCTHARGPHSAVNIWAANPSPSVLETPMVPPKSRGVLPNLVFLQSEETYLMSQVGRHGRPEQLTTQPVVTVRASSWGRPCDSMAARHWL
jgi:hypothetical protein